MHRSKESVLAELAQAHYSIDPGIRRIIRLLGRPEQEKDPKESIKLLEVNDNAVSEGIHPLFFGADPASGILFSSVIVDVTPEEFENIRNDPSLLPNGWRLGPELPRLTPATAE